MSVSTAKIPYMICKWVRAQWLQLPWGQRCCGVVSCETSLLDHNSSTYHFAVGLSLFIVLFSVSADDAGVATTTRAHWLSKLKRTKLNVRRWTRAVIPLTCNTHVLCKRTGNPNNETRGRNPNKASMGLGVVMCNMSHGLTAGVWMKPQLFESSQYRKSRFYRPPFAIHMFSIFLSQNAYFLYHLDSAYWASLQRCLKKDKTAQRFR